MRCSFVVNLLVVTLRKSWAQAAIQYLWQKIGPLALYPRHDLGGCTSLLLPPGAENPSYATGIGIARDSITACSRCCSRVSELPWVGNYGSGRPGSKHFRPSSSCEWSTHAAVLSLRWVLVRVAIPLRGMEVFVLVTEFQGMAVNGLYCADVLRPLDLVPLTDFTYKYHPTEGIGVGAGGGQEDRSPYFQDWGIIPPLSAVI